MTLGEYIPMYLFVLLSPRNFSSWFGELGYLLLLFTPGAWITFALALDSIPFWARLFTGAILSPLVVCGEFYAIRLIGIPFGPTSIILVMLNLPAVYLIWKHRPNVASLDRSDWLIGASVLLIPVACMMSLLINMDARIYSAHAWLHADPVYEFARGQLVLEDPTLAGIRLTYPVWSGLVFQAVHSYLVNSPPVSSYVWSNLVWLILIYGFAVGITKEMGGGKLAQFSSGIFLFLGTNPVGYILAQLWPGGMYHHQLFGDRRYTPWVSKFQLFSPMSLALGMMIAAIYLLVRAGPLTRQSLAVNCLLLCGIGLFYPLLLPSACGIVGAKALALLAEKQNGRRATPYKEWLGLAGLVLVAVVVTYSQLRFLTLDKPATNSLIMLSTLTSDVRKTVESLIATSLLVAGLAFSFRDCWKSRRSATVFLLGGALASYLLHAAVHIEYYDNEYKFIFPVAMCLVVFPALAVDRIWREWPRTKAVPALSAVALLLVTTYAHWTYLNWPAPWVARRHDTQPRPAFLAPIAGLDAGEFYLQLDQGQLWSGVCNAVRRLTPADSILVLNNSALYYPGLTARSLYVSPINRIYPGVNLSMDLYAEIRGNDHQILAQRRATLADLFDAMDPSRRQQALDAMLALKRPIAIIAERQDSGLLEWLENRKTAMELYAEDGLSLWLINGEENHSRK